MLCFQITEVESITCSSDFSERATETLFPCLKWTIKKINPSAMQPQTDSIGYGTVVSNLARGPTYNRAMLGCHMAGRVAVTWYSRPLDSHVV